MELKLKLAKVLIRTKTDDFVIGFCSNISQFVNEGILIANPFTGETLFAKYIFFDPKKKAHLFLEQ